MSTRAHIIVKVRPEDKGKTMQHKEELLPKGYKYGTWDKKKEFPEVKIGKTTNYLCIYHHWDGYPSGLGDTLLNNFDTYEKALNIVLGGDMSNINNHVASYFNRGEDWKSIKPVQLRSKAPKVNKETWCEYAYLLDEDNKWYVAQILWDNPETGSYLGEFEPLDEVLANEGKEELPY